MPRAYREQRITIKWGYPLKKLSKCTTMFICVDEVTKEMGATVPYRDN